MGVMPQTPWRPAIAPTSLGTGTPTVAIAEATEGRVLVKTGAEGYAVAFLPAEGLGVALKTADGADRARWVILIELLDRAGLLSRAEAERLASLRHPAVLNSVGREVGVVRPALRRASSWRRRRGAPNLSSGTERPRAPLMEPGSHQVISHGWPAAWERLASRQRR